LARLAHPAWPFLLFAETLFRKSALADHRGEGAGCYVVVVAVTGHIDKPNLPVAIAPIPSMARGTLAVQYEAAAFDNRYEFSKRAF
jgi:hypothetical protein